MSVLVDKSVTAVMLALRIAALALAAFGVMAKGQTADSLKGVRRVFIGSLGPYEGAQELKRELTRHLDRGGQFTVVPSAAQADAVIDGRGELWVRGYRSLSPRARASSVYAEPVYDGYLAVKVHGKDDEILWSYFADPRRVSFRDLKRDLADEVASHLALDRNAETGARAAPASVNEAPVTMKGAGASFPLPLYQDWFKSFHARHAAWSFQYEGTGSEAGIRELAARHIDFAGSDIPPDAVKAQLPEKWRAFPTVAGGVVLIYNLPRFTGELRLTPEAIAGIFSGTVKSWNDGLLTKANESAGLPQAPIAMVHRSDGSGTTYAFTDFLSNANESWRNSFGKGARIAWAGGKGADGSEAVAQAVAATPYSMGYVEFIYAFNHHLSFASVRNAAGRFVQADLLSIMAAANVAGDKEEYMGLSIANASPVGAYPISTFSWMIGAGDLEPAKKVAVEAFFEWMLTSGQRECSALGYVPLPKNLVDRELSAVRRLR